MLHWITLYLFRLGPGVYLQDKFLKVEVLGQRCALVISTAAPCKCSSDSSLGSDIWACPLPHFLPQMVLSKEAESTSFLELFGKGRNEENKEGKGKEEWGWDASIWCIHVACSGHIAEGWVGRDRHLVFWWGSCEDRCADGLKAMGWIVVYVRNLPEISRWQDWFAWFCYLIIRGVVLHWWSLELKSQVLHESLQESQRSQAAHAVCSGLRRASVG